jgi:hypothetical protein
MNDLLQRSFPYQFGCGEGGPGTNTYDKKWLVYANRRYDNSFSTNIPFQAYMFNHNMLRAAAQAVSRKIKNNPVAMQLAMEKLDSPEWQGRLAAARADPGGEGAKKVRNGAVCLPHRVCY